MEVEMLVPACLNKNLKYYTSDEPRIQKDIINENISSIHVCNSFGHA